MLHKWMAQDTILQSSKFNKYINKTSHDRRCDYTYIYLSYNSPSSCIGYDFE